MLAFFDTLIHTLDLLESKICVVGYVSHRFPTCFVEHHVRNPPILDTNFPRSVELAVAQIAVESLMTSPVTAGSLIPSWKLKGGRHWLAQVERDF